MPQCPYCKTDLFDKDLSSGVCPHCQQRLAQIATAVESDTDIPRADNTSNSDIAAYEAETMPPKTPTANEADDATRVNPDLQQRSIVSMAGVDAGVTLSLEDDSYFYDIDPRVPDTESDTVDIASGRGMPSGDAPRTRVEQALSLAQGDSRYVIGKEINRGGMGAILRAVDRDIRREVAMKVILHGESQHHRARFVEEAQVQGQLDHPNIVPVHEIGLDAKGSLYFTMKLVKGKSLADIVRDLRAKPRTTESKYPLGRLLTAFTGVCNGISFAHSRGVVHRDLKPANVMLGEYGEVLVMDWGLAKVGATRKARSSERLAKADPSVQAAADEELANLVQSIRQDTNFGQTLEGQIMGTAAYMPPEQADSRIEDIDERSDVYSLGAILYEILTLYPPVEGGTFHAVLNNVLSGNIMPPKKRAPGRHIPPELAAVAMKAMAKDPRDRYQTADELRRDIELFQQGHRVSAKRDTVIEAAAKFVKRNRAVSIATATAAAILLIVVSVAAYKNQQEKMRRAQVEKEKAQQALAALEEKTRREELERQQREGWDPVFEPVDFKATKSIPDGLEVVYVPKADIDSKDPEMIPAPDRAQFTDSGLKLLASPSAPGGPGLTMLRWKHPIGEDIRIKAKVRSDAPIMLSLAGDGLTGYRLVLMFESGKPQSGTSLETVARGEYEVLQKGPITLPEKPVHEVEFVKRGTKLQGYVDGEKQVDCFPVSVHGIRKVPFSRESWLDAQAPCEA